MSNPKERHYWSQLRAALTAGQWLSPSPAKAFNGTPLSWFDLFRKFNKHCKGYKDVAQVASSTQVLAVLFSKDQDERVIEEKEGEYALQLGDECVLLAKRQDGMEQYEELKKLESANFDTLNFALAYYAYAVGNPSECLAHLEKVPNATHVQNHIPLPSTLRASTLDVPSFDSTPTSASSTLNVPSSDSTPTSASSSFMSAESGATATPSLTPSPTISIAEIKDGRAWAMAETIRSLCLQGMSHELLSPSNPKKALTAYSAALPLLTIVETEFTASSITPVPTPALTSSGKGKVDFTSFTRFREVWRWVERLLWRAIVLGARVYDLHHDHRQLPPQTTCKQADSLWTWLGHYTSCSAYWPADFRTEHRSTVSALYLRALVLRHGPSSGANVSSNIKSTSNPDSTPSPPAWMHTARSIIQEYRAILTVSTRFPKAGERNWKVEDFVDMCVAIWEVAGVGAEYTGWVLDVLHWSTRLTFNSLRILRHMTRLLYVSGDTELAKRTLRLYVQLVSKAQQTIDAAKANGVTNGGEFGGETDTEGKQKWIETLVFGVRMLCRVASSSSSTLVGGTAGLGTGTGTTRSNWKEMIDGLKEARELVEKAKAGIDEEKERKELTASVLLAEGVWNWVMGLKEQDPLTRPSHLSTAHTLFRRSIEKQPTSAAHYHLALSYAYKHAYSQSKSNGVNGDVSSTAHPKENGNAKVDGNEEPNDPLDAALTHAAQATELCPREIRYWHLLGLLCAKLERWEAAVGALDMGRGVGEGADHDGDETEPDSGGQGESDQVEGLPTGDGLSHPLLHTQPSKEKPNMEAEAIHSPKLEPLYILPSYADPSIPNIPPASEFLQSDSQPSVGTPHRYESRYEAFEHALQLRMTQVTVSEYVEGVEGAVERLREVFEWVAKRRGLSGGSGEGQARPSLDGTRSGSGIMKLKSPSELRLGSQSGHGHDDSHGSGKATSDSGHVNGYENPVQARPSLSLGHRQSTATSSELHPPTPIPITISPATPDQTTPRANGEEEKDPMQLPSVLERDASKPKKMQQKLKSQVGQVKSQVHKSSVRISTISKKIGHGVVRNGTLRRVSSTSDLHSVLRPTSYQASSIHSRRRNSFRRLSISSFAESPPPPPPPVLPPSSLQFSSKWNNKTVRENRLLSDLWLMSAATFRRLGKIEQAKGAIQEAEVKDEGNPGVWVQLGLYYVALGRIRDAIDSFRKALFISTDDIAATVHLSRIYLFPEEFSPSSPSSYTSKFNISKFKAHPNLENVDLAAGMLEHITKGVAWDIPEAWYFLGKAYGFQGRKEKERECLSRALILSEKRGVRDVLDALGVCF